MPRRARPELTTLEPRDVPATVGSLDPSFATAGKLTLAGQPLAAVATQTDGKIVAVGSQGGDFLVLRFNPDGTPDTTFDTDGKQTVDFFGAADAATDVAIQPDGRIVVVGTATHGANGTDFAVARLNPDGSLDTSFDTDGKLTIDFAGGGTKNDTANAIAIAPNGNIYVVGTATNAGGTSDFGVADLNGTNGALVSAFGSNGKEFIDFGGTADQGNGIAIQQDGKLVVVGSTNAIAANGLDFAIARLDPTTGMLDATFNGTGQKTVNFGAAAADAAQDVTIQADGKIIVAGFTNINGSFDAGVVRLTAAGALDTSFDGDGLATVDFGGSLDTANRVFIQTDGRIVLAGNNDADAVVARLNPTNGALDPSFGAGGKATVDVAGVDAGFGADLTSTGRIVIAGTSTAGANGFVARLIGTVEKGERLAAGGATDGKAAVFTPDFATGQYGTTPAVTPASVFGAAVPVRVAVADVNGDRIPDRVLVTGPGTPIRFAVVSGADNATLLVPPTDPFGGDFPGGGFVAAQDLDNDGRAEIVVTPDQGGGPRVTVFSFAGAGAAPTARANFFGIDDPNFRGGCRAAAGDVNGDGVADLAVAAGFLGGPRVALFDGKTVFGTPTRLVNDFFAFPGTDAQSLRNGAFVAAGDVDGDGKADLIFGGGPGGAPRVFILSGATVTGTGVDAAQASPIANFFVAGNNADRGGVRVAATDADGDDKAEVVAGSGEGAASRVRVYLGKNFSGTGEPATFQDLDPFAGAVLPGGVFVG